MNIVIFFIPLHQKAMSTTKYKMIKINMAVIMISVGKGLIMINYFL